MRSVGNVAIGPSVARRADKVVGSIILVVIIAVIGAYVVILAWWIALGTALAYEHRKDACEQQNE